MEDRGTIPKTDDDDPLLREQWAVDMKSRIDGMVPDLIESSKELTGSHFGDTKPSIFWTDSPPKKFYIGYLCRWSGNTHSPLYVYNNRHYIQSYTWVYVAFMTKWLGLNVTLCFKDIKGGKKELRACYDEVYQTKLPGDSEDFHERMLIAGCFLCFALFSLQKAKKPHDAFSEMDSANAVYNNLSRIIMEDPTRTKLDILNPMNQIPLFVLNTIFINSNLGRLFGNNGIMSLVMSAFDDLYPRGDNRLELNDHQHVLEIFYTSRARVNIPQPQDIPPQPQDIPKRIEEFYIPNATELLGSATVFKKLDAGLCEVNFSNKLISAEMQITPMHIFPYTRELYTHLRNFEWKCRRTGINKIPITSFLAIMKNLLQTTEDVKILQKKGIVKNTLPGEEDVLVLMQDIWKQVGQEAIVGIPIELDNLSKEVIKRQEGRFTVAYAGFKRQYCPSRWVAISIFAAFILFGLTVVQTIYTALGYYKT